MRRSHSLTSHGLLKPSCSPYKPLFVTLCDASYRDQGVKWMTRMTDLLALFFYLLLDFLLYFNHPKELIENEAYRLIITAKISVKKMARRLKRNVGKLQME
jgi:hypothetical protein